MPVEPSSISVGRCYVTPWNEVRKVVEIEGATVRYVVRGKLAFPVWDKQAWQSSYKDAFAREAQQEVPCDWHAS
jgi:hypothetical protein